MIKKKKKKRVKKDTIKNQILSNIIKTASEKIKNNILINYFSY